MRLEVGQRLWHVPRETRWSKPHFVTIDKVGRKWATLNNRDRVDIETLEVDPGDFGYSGRCYLSREEWDEERRADVCWSKLQAFMRNRWSKPRALTKEQIREVAQTLGGEALVTDLEVALSALDPVEAN